jgi:TPR repeat protein
MLRAVGLVCVIIFSGILREYRALIGPEGLAPLSDLMATLRDTHPNLAAARLGLAAAQDQLGIMLLSGEARPRDEIEALAWFIIAANQGNAPAIEHRDTAITHMSPAAAFAGQQRSKTINERIGASTPKD